MDQATYFEKVIGVPNTVLYFNTSEKICTERCLERAKTSGRADDTEETIIKRLRTYNDMSKPVVELYKKRKLVVEIDGAKDAKTVWEMTQKGMPVNKVELEGNPKIFFVLGGPGSGKRTQCANLVKADGYTHISTSELFRAEVAKVSNHYRLIA